MMKAASWLARWDRLRDSERWCWGLGLGGLSLVLVTAVDLALDAWWDIDTSEVAVLLPVVIGALFGFGPGLVVTCASVVVVDFFFLGPPQVLWAPDTVDDLLVLATFTALALIVSALVAALSRARRTYQSLIVAAPMPILRTDAQGRVADVNPAAARLFGGAADHLLGQRLAEILGAKPEVTTET